MSTILSPQLGRPTFGLLSPQLPQGNIFYQNGTPQFSPLPSQPRPKRRRNQITQLTPKDVENFLSTLEALQEQRQIEESILENRKRQRRETPEQRNTKLQKLEESLEEVTAMPVQLTPIEDVEDRRAISQKITEQIRSGVPSFELYNKIIGNIVRASDDTQELAEYAEMQMDIDALREFVNETDLKFPITGQNALSKLLEVYQYMSYAMNVKAITSNNMVTLDLAPADYNMNLEDLVFTIGFALENGDYKDTPVSLDMKDALLEFFNHFKKQIRFPAYERTFIDAANIYLKSILDVSFKFIANQISIPTLGNSVEVMFYRILTTFTLMYKFESRDPMKFMSLINDMDTQVRLYQLHAKDITIFSSEKELEDYMTNLLIVTGDVIGQLNLSKLTDAYLSRLNDIYGRISNGTIRDSFVGENIEEILNFTGRFMRDVNNLNEYV